MSPASGWMSVAVFYVLAVLVLAAALVAVGSPSTRLTLLAVMITDILVGLLVFAAGARALGAVVVVLPALCLVAVTALLRRAGYAALLADLPPLTRRWPVVAAISAGIGILLAWTANAGADDRVSGASAASLVTLLHYRFPVSLGVGLIVAAVAVGGALLIGRTGDDERRLDQATAQRRHREERALARRTQRAAARDRRGDPRVAP